MAVACEESQKRLSQSASEWHVKSLEYQHTNFNLCLCAVCAWDLWIICFEASTFNRRCCQREPPPLPPGGTQQTCISSPTTPPFPWYFNHVCDLFRLLRVFAAWFWQFTSDIHSIWNIQLMTSVHLSLSSHARDLKSLQAFGSSLELWRCLKSVCQTGLYRFQGLIAQFPETEAHSQSPPIPNSGVSLMAAVLPGKRLYWRLTRAYFGSHCLFCPTWKACWPRYVQPHNFGL